MIFTETRLKCAYTIAIEKIEDERGFFARSWCQREFAERGLNSNLSQCNISFNRQKGIIRGMHYQSAPHEEAKTIRCTRGALYDVIIDLRPTSKTFTEWVGVELSAANQTMLYVPEGFAHGFLTLSNNTEVIYQMSEFYVPEAARGVRYDDPAFNIDWPDEIRTISDRDRSYSDFQS